MASNLSEVKFFVNRFFYKKVLDKFFAICIMKGRVIENDGIVGEKNLKEIGLVK